MGPDTAEAHCRGAHAVGEAVGSGVGGDLGQKHVLPASGSECDAFHRPRGSETDSAYLSQEGLEINEEVIMDEHGYAVMMKWEQPLMQAHADFICGSRATSLKYEPTSEPLHGGSGSDVSANECGAMLNIGFGMGLVDDAIQSHSPALHVICEAHPKVLARAEAWAKVNPFLKTRSHPVSASPEPLQK